MIATPVHSIYFTRSGARLDGGERWADLHSDYFRDVNPGYSVIPLDSMFTLLGGMIWYDDLGRLNVHIQPPALTETPEQSCVFHGYSLPNCPIDKFLYADVYRTFGYSRVRESLEHPNWGVGDGMRGLMNKVAVARQGTPYAPDREWLRIGNELVTTFFAVEFGATILSTVGWAVDPVYMLRLQQEEAAVLNRAMQVAGMGIRQGANGRFTVDRGMTINSARYQAITTRQPLQTVKQPDSRGMGSFRLNEYRWNNYEFDGAVEHASGVPKLLIDAKGGFYGSWFQRTTGELYPVFRMNGNGVDRFYVQAQQQVTAAGGIPIRWYWQDEVIMAATRKYILTKPDGPYLLSQIEFVNHYVHFMGE